MESAYGAEGEVRRAGQVGVRGVVVGDDASGYNSPAEGRDNAEAEGDGARGNGRLGRKKPRPVQGTPRRPSRSSAAAADSRAGWSRVDPAGKQGDSSPEDCSASRPRGDARPPLGRPTWPRTKRWKLLRLWRCRGAWASRRQLTRPGFPDGARADEAPSGWQQPLRRVGLLRPTRPPRQPTRSGLRRSANSSLLGEGSPRRSPRPSAPRAACPATRKKPSMYPRTRSWRSSVKIALPYSEWRAYRCRRSVRRTGRCAARRP
jgi:hypothetical protein